MNLAQTTRRGQSRETRRRPQLRRGEFGKLPAGGAPLVPCTHRPSRARDCSIASQDSSPWNNFDLVAHSVQSSPLHSQPLISNRTFVSCLLGKSCINTIQYTPSPFFDARIRTEPDATSRSSTTSTLLRNPNISALSYTQILPDLIHLRIQHSCDLISRFTTRLADQTAQILGPFFSQVQRTAPQI
jgi:hypothetical protein